MITFAESLENDEFIVTAEISPPKGTDLSGFDQKVLSLKGLVQAVNVTDNQKSIMRASSLCLCRRILDLGAEPVFQLTCRDRNRLALQSDLLGADILGIHNVLCLTGDHVVHGDHPGAKPVFDLEAVSLLQAVSSLNRGEDLAGNKLNKPTGFLAGAVVNPRGALEGAMKHRFINKVDTGARFFQTQVIFDVELFSCFMKTARPSGVKVLAGVFLLKSFKQAEFINNNIPGCDIPEPIIKRLEKARKPKAEGLAIASEIIQQLKPLCDGVHIMAIGQEKKIPKLINKAF